MDGFLNAVREGKKSVLDLHASRYSERILCTVTQYQMGEDVRRSQDLVIGQREWIFQEHHVLAFHWLGSQGAQLEKLTRHRGPLYRMISDSRYLRHLADLA